MSFCTPDPGPGCHAVCWAFVCLGLLHLPPPCLSSIIRSQPRLEKARLLFTLLSQPPHSRLRSGSTLSSLALSYAVSRGLPSKWYLFALEEEEDMHACGRPLMVAPRRGQCVSPFSAPRHDPTWKAWMEMIFFLLTSTPEPWGAPLRRRRMRIVPWKP